MRLEIGHQFFQGRQHAADGLLVSRVEPIVADDRYKPRGELVRLERPPLARLEIAVAFRIRTRLHKSLGRLVLREHQDRTLHVRNLRIERVIVVEVGPPKVAAPDEPVALGTVRHIGVSRSENNIRPRALHLERFRTRGYRRQLAGAHRRLPDAVQPLVATGKGTGRSLRRVDAVVAETKVLDRNLHPFRRRRKLRIADEPLAKRRTIRLARLHGEVVIAVDVRRQNRQVDVRPEIARTRLAPEVALGTEPVRMRRVDDMKRCFRPTVQSLHLKGRITSLAVRAEINRHRLLGRHDHRKSRQQ